MHIFGFWIPKLSKSRLEQRKSEDEFLLSEEKDEDRIYGTLKYIHSKDNNVLDIALDKETLSFPKTLSLKRLFYDDESGIFFFYTEENLSKSAISNIQRSIYSVFKEMFHSHEHHFGDEDSILEAFHIEVERLPNREDIPNLWRKCLLHYIEQYRKKFEGAVEWSNSLQDIRTSYDGGKLFQLEMNAIADLLFELYGLIGEIAYFKFLVTELITRKKVDGMDLTSEEDEKEIEKELSLFLSLYQSKLNSIKDELEFYLSLLGNDNLEKLAKKQIDDGRIALEKTYKSLKIGILGFSIGAAS